MNSVIASIGTANPSYKRPQHEIPQLISEALALKPLEKRLLKSVYRATGIEYRYSVLSDYCKQPGDLTFFPNDASESFPKTSERMKIYKENALPLALKAIEDCFSLQSDIKKSDITHIITISCTGMYAPGLDIEILQHLQLNSDIQRTAIQFMGCYGSFNGLKMADTICRANENATVLMVSVEICTIHFQKEMALDNIIANSIFADGAACALIQRKKNQKNALSLDYFHCDLLPQSEQAMAWHIGDYGFDIALSSYVPDMIQQGIQQFILRLLSKNQNQFSDIDLFAIHPGGLKILQACEEALGITQADNQFSYDILRDYGNMSSATVLFVLKKIWQNMLGNTGKKILSCAFGPGLTVESMVLSIN